MNMPNIKTKDKNVSDIKVKDNENRFIKTLNKTDILTNKLNMNNITQKKFDNSNQNENNLDYGETKIKEGIIRSKNDTFYTSRKIKNHTLNKTKDIYRKMKEKKVEKKTSEEIIKATGKSIKTAEKTAKTTEKTLEESVKTSKKILEEGRKLAVEGAKATVTVAKTLFELLKSGVIAIIEGLKSLVGLIIAGGSISVIIIVIVCFIALLCASMFGIFFSSEKTASNSITMNDCIVELNTEMDNKIKNIENSIIHDEVIINSNKADWKDMLALYTIKISNGTNQNEVLTINDDKKQILKEIFWDMNNISSNIVSEEYDDSLSIGSWERDDITDLEFNMNYEKDKKQVLHIDINSKSVDEMIKEYNFNELQLKQYEELSSPKYLLLWNNAIYGFYGSNGEFVNWKQKGESWSDIRIGTTSKTIGDIGCLVTTVSILIKKSGVSTNDVNPFNPGTFVIALNNNYGFDKSGNLKYASIEKVVPNFVYQGHINLRGKTKSEKLYEIKKYLENGYYLTAEVKGATKNSQHWVAVDNVSNGIITMIDPASNETNMWSKYDWNKTTQFVYFKNL